jgi:Protein of unknown function (DUF2867)
MMMVDRVQHMNRKSNNARRAATCKLPASSKLMQSLARIDYCDSYEVALTKPNQSLVSIYGAALDLDHLPGIFKQLLVVRSVLVKPFGIAGVSHKDLAKPIDTGRTYNIGDKIGRWTLYASYPDELITGANDKHLDFRVSVIRDGARVVLSTVVMTHNTFGRAYLATILPFHKFGVAQILTNAATAGRL